MDPFTITTGVVTLIGACATTSRTLARIRKLREAPALIQAVNNEIADLRLILVDISDHFGSLERRAVGYPGAERAVFELCATTIERTRDLVQDVDALIRDRLLKPGSETDLKINRTAFWRERENLVQIQTDLQVARQRIAHLFGRLGVQSLSRVEVQLNDIYSNHLPILNQSQARIERTLDRIIDRQLSASNTIQAVRQTSSAHNLKTSQASSVQVSVSRLPSPPWQAKCTCRRQSTSIRIRTFLGSLFFGYAAVPMVGNGPQQCSFHKGKELRLIYVFPMWFIRYAFALQTQLSSGGSITCTLSFRQIIPHDHTVYDAIGSGDLQGIKELLTSRQVSIEAHNWRGIGLLHVRRMI